MFLLNFTSKISFKFYIKNMILIVILLEIKFTLIIWMEKKENCIRQL